MVTPIGNVKVEIAWDSGFSTLEGDRTWTDVTTDVWATEGIGITYGRTDQQTSADPNALSLTLKNDAGKYTPGNTGSPYYPNVKKGRPVRVSTTYGGTTKVRYTGYVNEWPVVWPDGSDRSSTVTITASSRRARLGQTAPLTSAIRAAYLATGPTAYWPMDEDTDVVDRNGRQVFRDLTNQYVQGGEEHEFIGSFAAAASAPVVRDGTAGPTDEESLVRLSPYTDVGLLFNRPHYIGGGNVIRVNTGGEFTVECVARIVQLNPSATSVTSLIWVGNSNLSQALRLLVNSDGTTDSDRYLGQSLEYTSVTGVFVDSSLTSIVNNAGFATATDGNIHHFAMTLTGGNTVISYLDGVPQFTAVLNSPWLYDTPFTGIAFAGDTYFSTVWVGHGAVTDRALSAAEVLSHAQAATAASETTATRVARIAGRVGVPAAEVDAETTVAAPLGPQPEAGRSAVEVLDELAASTGGILYDTRAGHLAMQARSHRYNQTAAFTLDTAGEELEVDLTVLLDAQYLINSVDLTEVGGSGVTATLTDAASIADYGVYSKSIQIVSASAEEAVSAASDQLFRYSTPRTRISQVSVDVGDLTSAQRNLVLNADIGTLFNVTGLPSQAPATTMALYVEGYTESIGKDAHTITFNTTPGDFYTNVLILDDPAHDVLDSGVTLAY